MKEYSEIFIIQLNYLRKLFPFLSITYIKEHDHLNYFDILINGKDIWFIYFFNKNQWQTRETIIYDFYYSLDKITNWIFNKYYYKI